MRPPLICIHLSTCSREIQDLNRGRDFLTHLLSIRNVALFDNTEQALAFSADWLHCVKGDFSQIMHSPLSSSFLGTDFAALLIEAHTVFNQYDHNQTGPQMRALCAVTQPRPSVRQPQHPGPGFVSRRDCCACRRSRSAAGTTHCNITCGG